MQFKFLTFGYVSGSRLEIGDTGSVAELGLEVAPNNGEGGDEGPIFL
jgi:hypothetical protein